MINCVICDDEPLARKGIENYLKKIDGINFIYSCENIFQLETFLENNTVDLLLLDIEMPQITGLTFLKKKKVTPITIIISAYSHFALEGYELDVMDYLVKPVSFERFLKAIEKAKAYWELTHKKLLAERKNYFFIKLSNTFEKINFDSILYVQALQNYVIIQTLENRFVTHTTLKSINETLPSDQFIKTHKSYIVSISKIETIRGNEIKIGTEDIPMSRNLKEKVLAKLFTQKMTKLRF